MIAVSCHSLKPDLSVESTNLPWKSLGYEISEPPNWLDTPKNFWQISLVCWQVEIFYLAWRHVRHICLKIDMEMEAKAAGAASGLGRAGHLHAAIPAAGSVAALSIADVAFGLAVIGRLVGSGIVARLTIITTAWLAIEARTYSLHKRLNS